MEHLDKIIFNNKKFSDLLSEIYDNQKKKETQISSLIAQLKPLIVDIGDATLIVPLIKEYLEIGVKNDEQLIKLSAIVQKLTQGTATTPSGDSLILSEKEREELLKNIEDLGKNSNVK